MNKHISSSGTIKKCSIILNKVTKKTLILLDVYVLKIGEYDSSYILGYSPVFNRDIRSPDAFKPICRQQKYLMDYKVNY